MKNRAPNFRGQAAGNVLELYIYDEIGGWGIWAEDVAYALRQSGVVDTLRMRFHTPGGDMQEASAIRNLIETSVQTGRIGAVESVVDGRAFSAGTYLALTAPRVQISQLGLWMIHKPMARIQGNSGDLRQAADVMDALEETVNAVYADKTGAGLDQVRLWVAGDDGADGTTFTAAQALEAGFVDEIISPVQMQSTDEDFDNVITEQQFTALDFGAEQPPVYLNRYCRIPATIALAPDPTPVPDNVEPVQSKRQAEARAALAGILNPTETK